MATEYLARYFAAEQRDANDICCDEKIECSPSLIGAHTWL